MSAIEWKPIRPLLAASCLSASLVDCPVCMRNRPLPAATVNAKRRLSKQKTARRAEMDDDDLPKISEYDLLNKLTMIYRNMQFGNGGSDQKL